MTQFLSTDLVGMLHTAEKNENVAKKIILCPSFTLLPEVARMLERHSVPLHLGAQNVSAFPKGAHTGEESAEQVAEFAEYVIIGHSERRKEQSETDDVLSQKVNQAREFGLEPIFCVQGKETMVPEGVHIVAYEPLDAIGTGKPASPETANEVAAFFKKDKGVLYVLYGGSVTSENVRDFTRQEHINGVLVGGGSLDPTEFALIVKNA